MHGNSNIKYTVKSKCFMQDNHQNPFISKMTHELKQDIRIKNKNKELSAQLKANVAVSTLLRVMLPYEG